MSCLVPNDRDRLAKLLGLLGSDHAGERDAAALAAHRFLQQRGMTWRDAIEPAAIGMSLPETGAWRNTVARCLECVGSLRPWECTFLRGLPAFPRLSVKQSRILREIANRVLSADAAR
jgi:hypothetical protein